MLVCVFWCVLHTRPRVQRAPGLPCALFLMRAEVWATLGHIMPRECGGMSPVVIARESGRSSTPRLIGSSSGVSGILDRPVKPGADTPGLFLNLNLNFN